MSVDISKTSPGWHIMCRILMRKMGLKAHNKTVVVTHADIALDEATEDTLILEDGAGEMKLRFVTQEEAVAILNALGEKGAHVVE